MENLGHARALAEGPDKRDTVAIEVFHAGASCDTELQEAAAHLGLGFELVAAVSSREVASHDEGTEASRHMGSVAVHCRVESLLGLQFYAQFVALGGGLPGAKGEDQDD